MGRATVILLLSWLLFFSGTINRGAFNTGLVAWYPLHEIGGRQSFDRTPYHNNGQLFNNAQNVKYGLSVPGAGTTDYSQIQSKSQLQITNSFTISIWIKANNQSQASKHIFSKVNDANTNNDYALLYRYTVNNVEFYSGGYSGSDPRTGTSIDVSDTKWHHIVYTYNGSDWCGYKDGVQIFATTRTFSLPTGNNTLAIGSNNSFGNAFQGYVRDIRMYNRYMYGSEVRWLYQYEYDISFAISHIFNIK